MKKLLCMVSALIMLMSVMALNVSADTVYSQGDVDLSGDKIGASDLTYLAQTLLEIKDETTMTDVNEDGVCDVRDMVRLKKIIAGYYDSETITQGTNTFDFTA